MGKRKNAFGCIVLTALILMGCLTFDQSAAAVGQEINAEEVARFNVMMVIDGSGSLISQANGTDPTGLRYNAIDLFLALLTNDGNHIGAIVFDDDAQNYLLNTGLIPISGKTDKMSLSQKIRLAGTRNDTDIGSALFTAINTLAGARENDGMKSAIILFSDGRTDLGANEEAYRRSMENKEAALVKAQELSIPVYSICLNASSVADPAELQEISNRTSGGFVAVKQPEDLVEAFETFYKLIFTTYSNDKVNSTFPESGNVAIDIDVPTHGAKEVNIILNHQNLDSVRLRSPTQQLSSSALEEATMSGGSYNIVKLVDPEVGSWKLDLNGIPRSSVTVNVIYNVDSSVVLRTADQKSDYGAGDTVVFEAGLYRNGVPLTDDSVTKEYTADLFLTNMSDGTTVNKKMGATEDGMFNYSFTDPNYNSYVAHTVLTCDGLSLTSADTKVNFGNVAPTLSHGDSPLMKKVIVTPITGRQKAFRLTDYFSDAQDDVLNYSIVSSQLVADTASIKDNILTVNTSKSRSGDLVLRATDSQGAYSDMTIRFKVTNLTIAIFALIVLGVLLGLLALILTVYRMTHILFRGTLVVSNYDSAMNHPTRPHSSFRGKVKLNYFMIGACGMDPNRCYFMARPGGKIEFRSPKPVYVNGIPKNRVDIFAGSTTIYADVERTQGIRVTVEI